MKYIFLFVEAFFNTLSLYKTNKRSLLYPIETSIQLLCKGENPFSRQIDRSAPFKLHIVCEQE